MSSLPDEVAVFVDSFDSMQGDGDQFAFRTLYLKREVVPIFEHHLLKWDPDEFPFLVVEVSDFETASPEFFIPADSVEEFLNGNHRLWEGSHEVPGGSC